MPRFRDHDDLVEECKTFDPNAIQQPQWLWATFVPTRTGRFKVHRHRGTALNAISWHHCGVLYEHVEGRWVSRAVALPVQVEKDTPCVQCAGTLMCESMFTASGGAPVYNMRHYSGWRKVYPRGPIAEPVEYLNPLCTDCRDLV